MKDILLAAQAEIATRTREVFPTTDLGFGTDMSCTDDLAADFGNVSGPMIVLQSIYRDLITPPGGPDAPGSLPDDTEYGFGLAQYVQRDLTSTQLLKLSHELEARVLDDDRVSTCSADVTLDSAYNLTVAITGNLANQQGFRLVFTLTDGTLALQEMTADV